MAGLKQGPEHGTWIAVAVHVFRVSESRYAAYRPGELADVFATPDGSLVGPDWAAAAVREVLALDPEEMPNPYPEFRCPKCGGVATLTEADDGELEVTCLDCPVPGPTAAGDSSDHSKAA